MINFFRRIRQNLLSEGKTGKYLKYAIGETVLVVIGILMALQINNWNENRKKREQEAYYLNQLLEDFTINKSVAKLLIDFNRMQFENSSLLLKSYTDSLTPTESNNWFYAMNKLGFLPHNSFNDDTWKELQSTGNIGLIQNKLLVQKIAEFYSIVEDVSILESEWGLFNLDFRNKTNGILEPSLRFRIMDLTLTGKDTIIDTTEQFPSFKTYLDELKKIQGLQGLISDIQINRNVGHKEVFSKMEIGIDSIISLLKN